MLGSLVIVTFGNLLKAVSFLFEGRVERMVILEWFVKRTPEDMQFVFPVAMMLATLLTFSQMSRTQEIVALRGAGVSLMRLMAPVMFFSLLVTLGVFVFLDRIVPPSMTRSQELWDKKIRKNCSVPSFKENILLRDSANRLVFAGRFNLRTYELEYLKIRDYSPDGTEFKREFSARRGLFKGGKLWELKDLKLLLMQGGNPTLVHKSTQTMPIGEGPEDFAQEDRSPQEMSFATLLTQIRKLEERGLSNTLSLKVELYLKTSFPFCIPIFALIGCCMGLTSSRSGGFIGFGVSLVATFFYYIVMSLSSSLGKTGVLAPLLASWIHNIAFGIAALALVLRVQSR